MNRIIYACDIGSIRAGTFAWARVVPDHGDPSASCDIDDLVTRLTEDVQRGNSIALGFESPLFMPVPVDSANLNRGRGGEGNRSMFASAGASVTTLGVHEAAWILRAIRAQAPRELRYTLDWSLWNGDDRILLVWEAFVSGAAKSATHKQDAATAAVFFRDNEGNLNGVNAVTAESPLCLVHAAALWADWTEDPAGLHGSCLVLRPQTPYNGHIDPA